MLRHRRARIRRIRLLRSVRTARFWSQAGVFLLCLTCLAFWAKFAFVYDIPAYAGRNSLSNVQAYITVKPWWFGPPVFDLAAYEPESDAGTGILNPYDLLLEKLGRYQQVVASPDFVWQEKG